GAGRGQEPCPRRRGRRSRRLRPGPRGAAGRGFAVVGDQAATGARRLRPHRRLRRRHRHVVRRGRDLAAEHPPRPRPGPGGALRREPPPAGRPLPRGGPARVVGRHDQHGGKELSYLNLYDTEAAWRLVHDLGEGPAVAIIKHANPCGAAVADDIATAYTRAHECDPVSAFGGIVAANRPVTVGMAEALAPVFTEVVVAPGYESGALEVLTAKKNLR